MCSLSSWARRAGSTSPARSRCVLCLPKIRYLLRPFDVDAIRGYPVASMIAGLVSLLVTARRSLQSRAASQLDLLALRLQLHVRNRSRPRRVRVGHLDRVLGTRLSQCGVTGVRHSSSSSLRRSLVASSRLSHVLDLKSRRTPPTCRKHQVGVARTTSTHPQHILVFVKSLC
jgi:hypothetical protein